MTKKFLLALIAIPVFYGLMLAVTSKTLAITPPELVGWWRFEDNAYDSSSQGNNGALFGIPNFATGKVGKAVELDAVDDYVSAPRDGMDKTEGTFELWVMPYDLDLKPQAFMVVNTTAGIPHNYQIQYWTDGKLYFRVNQAGQEVSVNAVTAGLTENEWHHFAMTWDSSGVKAYVDGNLVGTYAVAMSFSNDLTGDLFIGSWFDTTRKFNGLIDEVRIWSEARDSSELGYFDHDLDGVSDQAGDDYCSNTTDETGRFEQKAQNRWWWDGIAWQTVQTKAKGPSKSYEMSQTGGCSCIQILDKLEYDLGLGSFEGHRKFGCSSSVLDTFILDLSDGEVDGYNKNAPSEIVEIPAMKDTDTESDNTLVSGKTYLFKARGMANAGDTIDFDAICSITNRIAGDTWTDLVSGYEGYGPTLLELAIDGTYGKWGTVCDPSHEYWYETAGEDDKVSFMVYDVYYPNNTGSLFVDIFQKLMY